MRNFSVFLILIVALFALAPGKNALGAQGAPPPHQDRSVANALAAWRGGDDAGERKIMQILLNPSGYALTTVDSAFAGTALLAVQAPVAVVRHRAASLLSYLGTTIYGNTPRSGVVRRARAIYESSGDRVVRGIIVRRMADQSERPEAIGFLKGVIMKGDRLTDEFDQSAVHIAIDALHRMGADGDEALQQVYATGRMGSLAAEYLEYLGLIPSRP